jgi:serine/threonine-protein kinase PknK
MGDPLGRAGEIRRLFDELADLAPPLRAGRMDLACGGDPELRQELEALFEADARSPEALRELDASIAPVEPPARTDPWIGRILPPYEIMEKVGGGGMGVVYKARDRRLDRAVALKFLPPHIVADGEALARFTNEARAASALDHPNICTIYAFDTTPDGHPYIAMAYVPGLTLREKIHQGPLAVSEAVGLAIQVARGLERAHEHSIIHRDIKPANLIVTERGELRILDFGVAHRAGSQLTGEGLALGTLAYMSPEQLQGKTVDRRTDLWSLGVVLFEMLAGRRPFEGESDGALWGAIVGQPAPDLGQIRNDIPETIAAVVARCLSKDPSARYPDAMTLIADLDALKSSGGPNPAARSMPLALSSFVGRRTELEAIRNLLGRARLVTLTGPPGMGKTRLASEAAPLVAAASGSEVFFVSLAALSDPSLVIPEVAAVLGIGEDRTRSASEVVRSFLRTKRALLVLDNFEQVIAAAGAVAELLSSCPGLRVLATSRVPLRLNGEYEFAVPPLHIPPLEAIRGPETLAEYGATELFLRRAQAVEPRFTATGEDARAVASICERLEGLPLAIELAAARIKIFSPQTLLGRLGKRLDLLKGGGTDRPARHQTLRQAIDWSYDLLNEAEKRCFRRLSVLSGGCTLEAAEAIGRNLGIDILEALSALVDKSLVRRQEMAGIEPRFQMLEMIREYALERLEEAGDGLEARRAHGEYFLSLAERVEPTLAGALQRSSLNLMESEHDNLRAALGWAMSSGNIEMALRIGGALWRFWVMRGHLREGRERLIALLALPGAQAPTRERARALHGAGTLIHEISDMKSARPLLEESLAIWRKLGDAKGTAGVLASIGWVALQQDESRFGRACSEEALEVSRQLGDTRGEAVALNNLGWASIYEGDFRTACPLLERSASLREKTGDRRGMLYVRTTLSWALCRRGENALAESHLDHSLKGLRELGDVQLIAHALNIVGVLEIDRDDAARAMTALEDAIGRWRTVANQYGLAFGLRFLAEARLASQNPEPADEMLTESLTLWTAVGSRWGEAMVIRTRSRLRLQGGDLSGARDLANRGLMLVRQIGDRHGTAEALEDSARISAAECRWDQAARDLGAADGLRAAIGSPRPPTVLRLLSRTLAGATEALGPEVFEAVRSRASLS